jgi:hypothetical protein
LDHRTDAYAGNDEGSVGFQPFQGGFGLIYDDNQISNTRSGIRLWNYQINLPVEFTEVMNNVVTGVQTGIDFQPNTGVADPNFIGVSTRHNSFSGASASYQAAANGISSITTATTALDVVENNTFSGFPIGASIGAEPDSLLLHNSFSLGSATFAGSLGVSFNNTATTLLQGNTYSGFQNTYGGSGTATAPTLEMPYDVLYLTSLGSSVSQVVQLLNDGAGSLSWSGSTDATWLTFSTSSGSIAAEGATPTSGGSAISLVADPTGLVRPGTYSATATITYGGMTRKLKVYFIVEA